MIGAIVKMIDMIAFCARPRRRRGDGRWAHAAGLRERRTEAKPEMVHPKPVQASSTPTSESSALCFDADATGAYCAASLGMGKASLSTKAHSRPSLGLPRRLR